MASFGRTIRTEELPEAQDFKPIPDGWYSATIEEALVKPTKDGTGERLNFKFKITGPTNAGRGIYEGLNIRNKNSEAENIAWQQFNSIMGAIGLKKVDDSDEFVGGNLMIKVATEESAGYDPKNVVKGYKALEGGAVPTISKPVGGSAPWAAKKPNF